MSAAKETQNSASTSQKFLATSQPKFANHCNMFDATCSAALVYLSCLLAFRGFVAGESLIGNLGSRVRLPLDPHDSFVQKRIQIINTDAWGRICCLMSQIISYSRPKGP